MKSAFFLIFGLFPINLLAQWSFNGAIQADSRYTFTPSSESQYNAFQLGHVLLQANGQVMPDWSVQLMYMHGEDRVAKRAYAYIQINNVLSTYDQVSFGLVPNTLLDWSEKIWNYTYVNPASKTFLEEMNYFSYSDQGYIYSYKVDSWLAQLQVVNGEGMLNSEEARRKDFSLMVATPVIKGWLAALHGSYGEYDGVDDNVTKKIRNSLLLGYKAEHWTLLAQGFTGEDAVDKINNKVAQKVDLTAFGGQSAKSEGASAMLDYSWGEPTVRYWSLFAKGSWLNPIKSQTGEWVRSQSAGVRCQIKEKAAITLSNSQFQFGESHSAAGRDASTWYLSLSLKM